MGIKLVCTENPGIPCLGRAVEDLGVGKGGGLGQAPKNRGRRQGAAVRGAVRQARTRQEPAEGAEVARRADAGVDAAEGGRLWWPWPWPWP